MGYTRERATWIPLPAGTCSHRKRISVFASPIVEGSGRDSLGNLPRFRSWPAWVSRLSFSVWIDGRELPVDPLRPLRPVWQPGLEPSEAFWHQVFPDNLDVDLQDLHVVGTEASAQGRRLPVAPPTAKAAAVVKARYAGEAAAPVEAGRANAVLSFSAEAAEASVKPEPLRNWDDYIRKFASQASDTPLQIAGLHLTESAFSEPQKEDPLQTIRDFHTRPRLPVYPILVRDERELPKKSQDEGTAPQNGHELSTFALASVTGPLILKEVPQSGPEKSTFPYTVPKPPPPEPGTVQTQSTEITTALVVPQKEDHFAGGILALRLRQDDQILLRAQENAWHLESLVIQVQYADDKGVLYARHFTPAGCEAHDFEFRLPPDPPPGFRVTIRSLERQHVSVTTGSGFRDAITAGIGKIYSWDSNSHAWTVEREDRQDFHTRVASLRAYPGLLRRLGLILDFDLPDEALAALGPTGRVRLVPMDSAAAFDLFPFTEFDRPDSRTFLPRREKQDTPYADGLLTKSGQPGRFKIVQLDTDSAALKLGATSEPLGPDDGIKTVSLELQGDPHQPRGLPTLRQQGIALCDTAVKEDTALALRRAADLTRRLCEAVLHPEASAAPNSAPNQPRPGDLGFGISLFAEDLVQGFRVDVQRRERDQPPGDWRSLCERIGNYYWSGAPLGGKPSWCYDDEGFITPAADEVGDPGISPKALRISQALFRWDGWSLAAERPGQAFDETGPHLSGPTDPNDGAAVRVRFEARPGSLERLRLGSKYTFRLRLVDLAGNSLSLEDANALDLPAKDLRLFNSGCFERPETLETPILVPCSMPGPAEGNDQWVIRSTANSCADPHSWLLLPPIASPSFVELHGVLDGLGVEESWHLLARHDDLPPKWDNEHRGYDPGWVARYSDPEGGLPYLPDPLCQSVAFRDAGQRTPVATLFVGNGGSFKNDYPRCISQRLVQLAPGREPEVKPYAEGLEFRLPPGRIAQLEMASCPSEDAIPVLGLLNWCDCEHDPLCDEVQPSSAGRMQPADVAVLRASCCAGEVPLVTPSRLLKLVHAVERPLVPAGRKAPGFVTDQLFRFENPVQVQPVDGADAGNGDQKGVSFLFKGKAWIDTPSTGKLDFRLNWKEPVDDPRSPELYEIDGSAPGFQVNVPLTRADLTVIPASPVHHGCGPAPCLPQTPFDFTGTVRFEDARHRRVRFQYDATSRFIDAYEPREGDPVDRFRIPSDSVELHVPARIPPEPPDFYYAVPTFSFQHERKKKTITSRRLGGLRLYLHRGWFSSGADEMLAVVFAQSRTAALPSPLDQLVSAWGEDPLWESQGRRLPERPLLADVAAVERPVPGLVTPLRFELPDEDDEPAPKPPEIDVELALAAYTPRLDPEKNLLFVDVDLRVPSYFPFVRLGLARYQPYALAGRELSAIVPAVFCQLMPDVTVTAVPRRRGCWEVSVVAPSGASPIASGPERIFRVQKVDHGDDADRLRKGGWPTGPSILLEKVVEGDDGLCRWSGVIETGWMRCGERLYVLEEQRWGDSAGRIVGIVPI